MQRRRSLLIGAAVLALAPAAARANAKLDMQAPDFTGTDSNGKTWSLARLKGKVVVIEVTNHDCPYVRKHYNSGNMQAQQREAAAKGAVEQLTANLRQRAGTYTGAVTMSTPRFVGIR